MVNVDHALGDRAVGCSEAELADGTTRPVVLDAATACYRVSFVGVDADDLEGALEQRGRTKIDTIRKEWVVRSAYSKLNCGVPKSRA